MSIHFAGARRLALSPLARCLARPAPRRACNDNYGAGAAALVDNPLMRAALEHFARHGLAAGETARLHAAQASAQGDADSCHHWRSIGTMLGKRG